MLSYYNKSIIIAITFKNIHQQNKIYISMFKINIYFFIFFTNFIFLYSIPGTKKMEYKTRQWHEKCFSCCVCKTPIGTRSFIPREQEIYCAGCYEEKFATRCIKCNQVQSFFFYISILLGLNGLTKK